MGRARRPQPIYLATKLKDIRDRLDLTQTQMVKRLATPGLSLQPGHISEFEGGTREPSLVVLLRYARIAGVPIEVLIDDEINLPSKLPSEPSEWRMVKADSRLS